MNEIYAAALAVLFCTAANGATNLVTNPSFENDDMSFVWGRMESPRERVKAKDDPRYVGKFDSVHVKDGKRSWLMRCDNPGGRNNISFTNLPVTPGKRYTFRAQYYIDAVDGPVMVWGNTHQFDEKGKTSGYYNTSHYDATARQWNEWTTSFYVPKNSKTTNVQLIFGGKMSVWLDDVSFFEDPEPKLAPPVGAILNGGSKVSLAWLSPLSKAVEKGLPEGLKDKADAVSLDAARNEKEHFQLVVSAKEALKGVSVGFDGFGGASSIPASSLRVRRVEFVPVANAKNPAMNRMHPDPVVEFSKGDVEAGDNLVLLVTVAVPKNAVPGEYAGSLRLASDDGELAKVPLKLRVRGFALPDTAMLKSYFYMSPGYGGGAYKKLDNRSEDEINDNIHSLFREIRITGNQALKRPVPKWELRDGKVIVTDWSPYFDEVRRLNREYGFTTIPCPFVGMLGDNAGWFKSKGRGVIKKKNGRTVGDGAPATPFGGFHDEPVGQGRVIDALSQFLVLAKKEFPYINFTWYIYDEPCYDVMDVLPKMVGVYGRALPDLNLFMVDTPYSAKLPPYHTRVAGFNRANINPQVVNFKETWFYQYAASIEDGNYLRNRFYPWQVYMAGGDGVLLWNVIHYGSGRKGWFNPWTNLTARYDHAQPTLFYPPREGKDKGTVMSMRTINISDAIDDFDYIRLYEVKAGRNAARKMLSEVLPEPLARPADPLAFLAIRRRMADALEND